MCDETTEAENETYLATMHPATMHPATMHPATMRLSRRDAGKGAGAALAAVITGCSSPPAPAKEPVPTPAPMPKPPTSKPAPPGPATVESAQEASPETTSRMVNIKMPDGAAEGFFVAPSEGKSPGVLMWPDVAGLREAFQTMATRLAGEGYAVLVVNPYYRSSRLPILSKFAEWRSEEGKAKIGPMRAQLTPEAITKDGTAYVAWLDQQPEVDEGRKLATSGYCMGGPFTIRTAAAVPQRLGVIASFHGGGLVTDEATSPHKLLKTTQAAALICIAQNDDERAPEHKQTLRKAADQAGIPAEIEVYPAQHGWCAIDSPVYDEEEAQRAWASMLATFERYL